MVTTAERVEGVEDLTRGYRVIDSDAHFGEWPTLWTERAPAKYKDRVPHVKFVDGFDKWFVDGDREFSNLGTSLIDPTGEKHYGFRTLPRFELQHGGSYAVKPRLELLDQMGIYGQITYPQATGFSMMKVIKGVSDPELRTIIASIYNEAMADVQRESGNRIFPQALLPIWEDQKAMMREARRAAEDLHLTGFVMGDKPELLGLPDYNDPFWQPLFEYCNDRRIPLDFHLGGTSATDAAAVPWSSFGPQRSLAILSMMFFLANAGTVMNFIFSGLFDKYRNLKIVSVESGVGWIPFVLESMEYQLDETVPDEVKLSRRPTEMFRDHVYATFWFEKLALERMVDVIGVENIMFETDLPHPTCLYPLNREHASVALAGLDEYGRRRILQDNAVELYRLPIG